MQVEINSKTLTPVAGQSLFDCADQVGVVVPTSCRKNGKCRECLVEVVAGAELLSATSPEEEHLRDNFRLSCRAQVVEGSGTIKCHTLRRGEMRIEHDSTGLEDIPGPNTLDPAVTRDGSWVLLDGKKLVEAAGPLHGLAVDVGTTTVVVRLVDLESGAILGVQSFENPQRFAGTDIMARIQYDTEQGSHLLQRTLLAYLGHAIEAMECDLQTVYEVVIAANTTMRDLLFGLDVYSVGQRPYRSVTENEMARGERDTTSLSTTAKKLRLPIFPSARVYGLPLVGGHVGADAAACLLAIGLADEDRTIAMMDIGTNTELVVGNRHRILAASCPAGPAFEGGAISCGMPGLDGAVETITLSSGDEVTLGVIGDGEPLGICGSGLIDGLSELLRTDRINELGRFVDESERFCLTPDEQVFIHEQDISELAQAKGANVAGLRIVLKNYGIDVDDLDRFYLAGGFAKHLDLGAARRIGLIPDLPNGKLAQIGNASIEGATRALCSHTARQRLESVVQKISHVELETDDQFFEHFVEGCQFIPMRTLNCPQ
ncbi:MAG: ASKHA domain-containing protein [Pirellulales bacterium]|nr:ASKHA domain-containing protein [Pirellulales bacterium]